MEEFSRNEGEPIWERNRIRRARVPPWTGSSSGKRGRRATTRDLQISSRLVDRDELLGDSGSAVKQVDRKPGLVNNDGENGREINSLLG